MSLSIDKEALRKDARSLGVALIIASMAAGFFDSKPSAGFIGASVGIVIWILGLIRMEGEK